MASEENESTEKLRVGGVAVGALIVMLGMVVSRLTGVAREISFAHVFGMNRDTDAYFQAFRVPDFMHYIMAGGALAAGFIPAFTERLAKHSRAKAWELFQILFTLLLLISATIIGVAVLFTRPLADFVGHGFDEETKRLCAHLMRIILPAQMFFVLGGLFMGTLNSLRVFFWSALTPIVYNLSIITAILLLGPTFGVGGVAWGVLGGAFAGQILFQAPALGRRGASFRPRWAPNDPGVRQVASLVLPVAFGLCMFQLNAVIGSIVAAGLGESNVSAFNYSLRLVWLPVGVFGSALGISLFPVLSTHAALEEKEDFRRKFSHGVRQLVFVTVPSAALLMLLAEPIVRVVFQTGKFQEANTLLTSTALTFIAPAVVFISIQQLAARAFYALQSPRIPVLVGASSMALCIGLSLVLPHVKVLGHQLGVGGLGLANAGTAAINCTILLSLLRKRIGGLEERELTRSVAQAAVGLVPLALLGFGFAHWWQNQLGIEAKMAQIAQTLGALALGGGAYLLCALALKAKEATYAVSFLRARLFSR